MKHLVIINPTAGGLRGKTQQIKSHFKAALEKRGESWEIYETKAPMDACRKIKAEAETGEELRVYACGGDGTFSECINGAAEKENVSVAIYPCGTGNDFVKIFAVQKSLFEEPERLVNGFDRPMDAILCNGRYSANIVSVGFDARVGGDVHKYSRYLKGKGSYILSLIVNLIKGINSEMTVTTPQGTLEGKFALMCVCNGQYYGGSFRPIPEARIDDGKLDCLVINKVSRLRFLTLVGGYAKGEYRRFPKFALRFDGSPITLKAPRPFRINVDGEMIVSDRADICIRKGALRLIYPEGYVVDETENEENEAFVSNRA